MIKQRRINCFYKKEQLDLVKSEEELKIISNFLPEQLTNDEIIKIVRNN